MTGADLLEEEIDGKSIEKNYPDTINADGISFSLVYTFDPASHQDGVTLKVPMNAAKHIPSRIADMTVPGLREEVIHQLLKNLPKEYRKQLQPLGEKISPLMQEISPKTENLFTSLHARIKSLWGVDIPAHAWRTEKLPPYLRIRYEIIDGEGNPILANRDMDIIRNHNLDHQPNSAWTEAQKKWEKKNITAFEPDELPGRIPLITNGRIEGYAFPALTDDQGTCAIQLFRNHKEGEAAHRLGMIRLYSLQITGKIKQLRKNITSHTRLNLWFKQLGDAPVRIQAIIDAAIAGIFNLATRDEKTCQESLLQGVERFLPYATDLLQGITEIMDAWQTGQQMIGKLRTLNKARSEILSYLGERENDLRALLPAFFPLSFPREDFYHLIRSMQALCIRMERGVLDLPKDQAKEKKITDFIQSHLSLSKDICSLTSPEKNAALAHLERMIREFQISVFAPELKTVITVSPKRLGEKIKEIEEMG
jgi:ATP-dependent helicase HrpA